MVDPILLQFGSDLVNSMLDAVSRRSFRLQSFKSAYVSVPRYMSRISIDSPYIRHAVFSLPLVFLVEVIGLTHVKSTFSSGGPFGYVERFANGMTVWVSAFSRISVIAGLYFGMALPYCEKIK